MIDQSSKGKIKINIHSKPFYHDPPRAGDFYMELGRAVVLWGRFEMNLSIALWSALLLPGSAVLKPLLEKGFPKALNKKRHLWKRAFTEIPILAEYTDPALKFISDVATVAKRRDALVHSAWTEFVSAEPPTCKAHRFNGSINDVFHDTRIVAIDELAELAGQIDRLNVRLIPYAWNLSVLCQQQLVKDHGKSGRPNTPR